MATTIEEFAYRYFSIQQTALVDDMLNRDKHMELYNNLHNFHIYTVELSTGPFTGTHNQLMIKKAEILKMIGQDSNEALKQDIELLETTQGTERIVYEWYVVPYWIARHMIDNDEVVLSWKDCYWWGRCIIGQTLSKDDCLKSLYSEIST